jgi:hypothetical protein
VQRRDPFYQASALVLDGVFKRRFKAKLPAHAVTTMTDLVGSASMVPLRESR